MIMFPEPLYGEHKWVSGHNLQDYPDWGIIAMAQAEYETYFLVHMPRDEVMKRLREELKTAETKAKITLSQKEELAKELERIRRDCEDMSTRNRRLVEEKQSTQARRAKLEMDLGKVRTEIGEARWREITGGDSE